MKVFLLLVTATAALSFGGCSQGLEVEDSTSRGPAAFSPDPGSHIAVPTQDPLGAPRI